MEKYRCSHCGSMEATIKTSMSIQNGKRYCYYICRNCKNAANKKYRNRFEVPRVDHIRLGWEEQKILEWNMRAKSTVERISRKFSNVTRG